VAYAGSYRGKTGITICFPVSSGKAQFGLLDMAYAGNYRTCHFIAGGVAIGITGSYRHFHGVAILFQQI